MHIRKQMPFTTSQILSERLRRQQVNAALGCDCSKALWSLVATGYQTIVDTLCQARQKEAVSAPLQAQAHRTKPTGAIETRFLPLQSSASCCKAVLTVLQSGPKNVPWGDVPLQT